MPEGAFYLFPDVSAYFGREAPGFGVITDSDDLCQFLLEARVLRHRFSFTSGNARGARLDRVDLTWAWECGGGQPCPPGREGTAYK